MIQIPVPTDIRSYSLSQLLKEILRRALDVSVNPAVVNVGIKVTGNDITISTGGNGLILTSRNGSHTGRLILENPDSNGNLVLSVDPLT